MYDPYSINPYKLRKLAALNTLYKLAAANFQQLRDAELLTGGNSGSAAIKEVHKNVENARQNNNNPSAKLMTAYQNNPEQRLPASVLPEPPKSPKKPGRLSKIWGGTKARATRAGKHIWKHKGAYGGGTVGTLGALAALYEGRQAHKSRKELANALERLSASDRGLSAARKRIKQLEGRGFFDYLFGRNK